MASSLFDQISAPFVARAVQEFYDRAFEDPIIGHFFFHKDKAHLVAQQTIFVSRMLGSEDHSYTGKPLREIHFPLAIRRPHFDRRQMLMREVLTELQLSPNLAEQWLALENRLRSQIVTR